MQGEGTVAAVVEVVGVVGVVGCRAERQGGLERP